MSHTSEQPYDHDRLTEDDLAHRGAYDQTTARSLVARLLNIVGTDHGDGDGAYDDQMVHEAMVDATEWLDATAANDSDRSQP